MNFEYTVKNFMDETLNYYNKNANRFVKETQFVDFKQIQDKFLNMLPSDALVLDFGCGSGRDTKYFHEIGYKVEAIDGSEELCRIASEFTGISVKHMLFENFCEIEKYDAIWACSSILHLSKVALLDVLKNMAAALKKGGIIYTSFKYGDFEGERNGRYFTDFAVESFEKYMQKLPVLCIEECWITGDVRPGRSDERWLNLILRKSDIH